MSTLIHQEYLLYQYHEALPPTAIDFVIRVAYLKLELFVGQFQRFALKYSFHDFLLSLLLLQAILPNPYILFQMRQEICWDT